MANNNHSQKDSRNPAELCDTFTIQGLNDKQIYVIIQALSTYLLIAENMDEHDIAKLTLNKILLEHREAHLPHYKCYVHGKLITQSLQIFLEGRKPEGRGKKGAALPKEGVELG